MSMRKIILTILLASTAAMPALAQDQGQGRHRDRGDRGAQSEAPQREDVRPVRAQREQRQEQAVREQPQTVDRAQWSARRAERQQVVEQAQASQPVIQQRGERRSWQQQRSRNGGGFLSETLSPPRTPTAPDDNGTVRTERRYRSGDARSGDWRSRDGRTSVRTGDRTSTWDRTGTRWSNQWRGDRNYDWRRHREHNRSVYRLGYYRDPYGSRYRRFSIGFSLFPSYYQSSYWLDDPYMYRLPPAYGPYRWVRYYEDALLVNIYTGQVVDVVYDFFW
jgi:Ni/Co efflux regulator RcnB